MNRLKYLRIFTWFMVVMLLGAWGMWSCGGAPTCAADKDCGANKYCDTTGTKQCRNSCKTTSDCLGDERCNTSGRCERTAGETAPSEEGPVTAEKPVVREAPPTDGGPLPEKTPEEPPSDGQLPGKSPLCKEASRACYTGPGGTQDKGPCRAGKQRCIDGKWSNCVGETLPKPEQCDGIDNDCDGTIDGTCSVWATTGGGKSGDEGNGIAVSSASDIYVTGAFSQRATFGSQALSSKGEFDAYVAKMDSAGKLLWAVSFGGTGDDRGMAVATDDANNVYAAGFFEGTVAFGDTTLSSKGGKNIYVAKLDPDGRVLWAVSAGGDSGGTDVYSIFADKSGNAYITGSFSEKASFGTVTLTSKGAQDAYVARLDASGKFSWATSAGGADVVEGFGVTADASGNAYVTGYFLGDATFGGSTLSSAGFSNAFTAKLDASGKFVWVTGTSQSWFANGAGIQVDSSGNVYVTGYFEEQAIFGNKTLQSQQGTDIFVAKLSSAGQYLWVISATGYGNSPGKSLGVDSAGNLYLVGTFVDRVTFGTAVVDAKGGQSVYAVKVSPEGRFLSAAAITGPNTNAGHGISVSKDGKAYVIGTYRGTITSGSTNLSSQGYTDAFVAKIQLQ